MASICALRGEGYVSAAGSFSSNLKCRIRFMTMHFLQLFHICNPMPTVDNNIQMQHYSFLCGNQTVFNQLTLTCSHEDDSIPCGNAPDFFYVNDNIGSEDEVFLTDNDVERGLNMYAGFGRRKPFDP